MTTPSRVQPTMPLLPGEKVERFAPATAHFSSSTGLPGVLHLTDQRLVFRPDGDGRRLDVRLRQVRNSIPFSLKLFGIIPTRRALRVSTDGRVPEEPWFVVDDPEAWGVAVTQARAEAPSRALDLATLLSAAEAEGREALSREAFASFLSNERGFPAGFWQARDEDGLLEVMGGRLADLGLPGDLLSDPQLRAELRRMAATDPSLSDAGEDQARRRQIALVAARINSAAGPAASTRRLYAFAEDIPGWEAKEPVWLLLNADERARLLALGIVSPPPGRS